MSNRMQAPALVAAALCAVLAGCESAEKVSAEPKAVLGAGAAYQRPALSLPPNYGERPEAEGEGQQAQAEEPLTRRERAIRRGEPTFAGAGFSPGTVALLKQTGVPDVPPNIRELVRRESTIVSYEDPQFVNRLITGDATVGVSGGPEIVMQRDDGPLPF